MDNRFSYNPVSTAPISPQPVAQPNRSNRTAFWIVIALISILIVAGAAAVAGYRYVNPRFAAWLKEKREQRRSGLPGAKKDLYGSLAGLRIEEVIPNSPAARAGLKYGDVLIAYNNRPITNSDEIGSVISYFKDQYDRTGKPTTAEVAFYTDGDMTVHTVRVPVGKLGVYTRDWTFAGAFVEDAIVDRDNYAAGEKYANEAAASGQYTDDQILHMRMLCVNNEKDGDEIRRTQLDELFKKHDPEKLYNFAYDDLQHNKRYHAAAAVFERYLKIVKVDVSTELNLALCYSESGRYDEAEALITKVLARSEDDDNSPSEYGMTVVSNIRGRIFMARRQYDKAQERFEAALERNPGDPYYTLAFLYCVAQRDAMGEKPGQFEVAYKTVCAPSCETETEMGYHIDALRAFTLVKHNRVDEARRAVVKWRGSADAKRYIPIFWRRFSEGAAIIDNWNTLIAE
jgi:tetratricopeptide (TPR) repeat protein